MMLNVCSLIKDKLYTDWTETDPPKTGTGAVKYAVLGLGFDFNALYPQILLDEITEGVSIKFITNTVQRVTHAIRITIFVRPVNYMPAILTAAELTFLNMKKEINRILEAGRYTITGINWTDLTEWRPMTMRGEEPIVLVASIIVRATYYI